MLTHRPLQAVPSGGLQGTQAPPEQIVLPPQTIPQAPQLFGSLPVSTQLPLQAFCVPGQLMTHDPEEHTSPLAQACPQVPQFAGSVR